MSLYYDIDTCKNIETFQAAALRSSGDDDSPRLISIRDEPSSVREDDRSKYLWNGARIISSDEGSNTVLCTQRGEWSVWLLDADGEPVRGSYFKSMREAAYDYAERVMGCHVRETDYDTSGIVE